MIPMFDTSILIDIANGDRTTVDKLAGIKQIQNDAIHVAFPAVVEFLHGVQQKSSQQVYEAESFLQTFEIVNTDFRSAQIMAGLKYKYEKKGIAMNLMDLMIAALAIKNNMVVITKDNDFNKIEELNKIILY